MSRRYIIAKSAVADLDDILALHCPEDERWNRPSVF